MARPRPSARRPRAFRQSIRLKAPREGETVIDDAVQGRVVFPNKDIDDFVLLRSDGAPTYMLAVVVDDHDMGVTQIIRGDDHLTNAARQKHIYEALGWETPAFAHIPLIHGPDGAKLSKRHGALGVDAYRAMGYLPAALRNYLVRLGWSQGDKEFFTTPEIDRGVRSRAGASLAGALRFRQARKYERPLSCGRWTTPSCSTRSSRTLPYLEGGAGDRAKSSTTTRRAQLLAAMPGLKARAKTLNELLDGAQFLFAQRPLVARRKGGAAAFGAGAANGWRRLRRASRRSPNWTRRSDGGAPCANVGRERLA